MQPDELESLVVQHLSQDFLTGAIRAVFDARRLAYDFCSENFESAEATNLRPLIARAKLNEYLRGIADVTPNCTATVQRSEGSPMQRTELTAGPIRLTAHTVQHPCGKVKNYQYRQSLARGNQGTLFDDESQHSDTLYVVLLHGPYRPRSLADVGSYSYLPGSIYLAFPTAALNDYVHRVDLIDRFGSVVSSLLPNDWDEEAKVFYRWQAVARDVG
jgi:hypothetical protein